MKTLDFWLQSLIYSVAAVFMFTKCRHLQRMDVLDSGILFVLPVIGLVHLISFLAHLRVPAAHKLVQHRRRYGWGVLVFLAALFLYSIIENHDNQVMRMSTLGFFWGWYYYWITWREWRGLPSA